VDWSNERYVRLYTRDTPDWLLLSWEARSLWMHLLRKFDRSGVIDLGRHGLRGLAATVLMPQEVVERALPELVEDGCLVHNDQHLVAPNYLPANEASSSDAQRAREYRERQRVQRRGRALRHQADPGGNGDRAFPPSPSGGIPVTTRDGTITTRDGTVTTVTTRHDDRHGPSLRAVPCRTVPDHAVRESGPLRGPQPPGWSSLPKTKQRVLGRHLPSATRLWDLQEDLRREALPSSRGLEATAERLAAVAERLEAGATEQECELVLRQYAAEAKQSDGKWFNGETNWRARNFTRALGQVGGSNGSNGSNGLAAKSGEQRASDMLDAIARGRQ
jgi:hypothetical protein